MRNAEAGVCAYITASFHGVFPNRAGKHQQSSCHLLQLPPPVGQISPHYLHPSGIQAKTKIQHLNISTTQVNPPLDLLSTFLGYLAVVFQVSELSKSPPTCVRLSASTVCLLQKLRVSIWRASVPSPQHGLSARFRAFLTTKLTFSHHSWPGRVPNRQLLLGGKS